MLFIKKIVYFILAIAFLSISLITYSNISTLSKQNKDLNQELRKAKEDLSTCKEVYELRNALDLEARDILTHLEDGDTEYVKNKVSENVTIYGDKLTYKKSNNQDFIIPKYPENRYILRQRAYGFTNDKKDEFLSIYEILSGGFETERQNTLRFHYINKDGEWLLDFLDEDE